MLLANKFIYWRDEKLMQDMSAQGARSSLPQNMKQAHFYEIYQSLTM